MLPNDYYSEKKWCPKCKGYVFYLIGLNRSYCVNCGGPVTLFSKRDREKFEDSLKNMKKGRAS
jgi:hypothetical protein